MGIRFFCPNGHKLNVKDHQAGQKGICPHCGAKFTIPLESTRPSSREDRVQPQGGGVQSGSPVPQSAPAPFPAMPPMPPMPSQTTPIEQVPILGPPPLGSGPEVNDPLVKAGNVVWYVRPPSGGQYGPANAEVMRSWLAEGRINADSLVWCEGWRDWQEAGNVFAELSNPSPIPGFDAAISESAAPATISLPRKSRSRTRNEQLLAIGGLAALVVVLFIIFIAIVVNQ